MTRRLSLFCAAILLAAAFSGCAREEALSSCFTLEEAGG